MLEFPHALFDDPHPTNLAEKSVAGTLMLPGTYVLPRSRGWLNRPIIRTAATLTVAFDSRDDHFATGKTDESWLLLTILRLRTAFAICGNRWSRRSDPAPQYADGAQHSDRACKKPESVANKKGAPPIN